MPAPHLYKMIRKAGTLEELKLILWRSIKSLEDCMKRTNDVEELRKTVNALVNTSREYLKLYEHVDMQKSIERTGGSGA